MNNNIRFAEGEILYFNPFYFRDNKGGSKPKYYIVLKRYNDTMILASLPTSQDHVPSNIIKKHGCMDYPDINFNCYYYPAGCVVCTNGFSFPIDTYVYGFRLQTMCSILHKNCLIAKQK